MYIIHFIALFTLIEIKLYQSIIVETPIFSCKDVITQFGGYSCMTNSVIYGKNIFQIKKDQEKFLLKISKYYSESDSNLENIPQISIETKTPKNEYIKIDEKDSNGETKNSLLLAHKKLFIDENAQDSKKNNDEKPLSKIEKRSKVQNKSKKRIFEILNKMDVGLQIKEEKLINGQKYQIYDITKYDNLENYLQKYTLTEKDKMRLFIRIIHLADKIHLKGIIINNITTTNIFLNKSGFPLFFNFDDSIFEFTTSRPSLNPPFMSPEMLENVDNFFFTKKQDIWSLGNVLYYMIFKKFLFLSANNRDDYMREIFFTQRIFFPKKTPLNLIQIFKKTLNLDPEKRINLYDLETLCIKEVDDFHKDLSEFPVYIDLKSEEERQLGYLDMFSEMIFVFFFIFFIIPFTVYFISKNVEKEEIVVEQERRNIRIFE